MSRFIVAALVVLAPAALVAQRRPTALPVPLAPAVQGVTVAGQAPQITVSWQATPGALDYVVLRSTDPNLPGTPVSPGLTSASFMDQAAAAGTVYFYTITARFAGGQSSTSTVVRFDPPAPVIRNVIPRQPVPQPAPATPTTPPGATLTPVAPPGTGPGPYGVSVTGNPAEARATWQIAPGASGYTVTRWSQSNPACCRAQSPVLPGNTTSWNDLVQWTGNWVFRVTAIYPPDAANPSGRQGFTDYVYTYPDPKPPTRFQAIQQPDGTVRLSWQQVPNASGYIVAGPPTNVAYRVTGGSTTISGLTPGTHTWQLWTQYDAPSGAASSAASSKVTASFTVPATGRYRIVVQSIQATQTTGDGQNVGQVLSTLMTKNDGVGDEIYVTSWAQTLERGGYHQVIQTFPIQASAVHGDVSAWPQDQRVRAGSASGNGGINPGDVISPVFGVPAKGAQGFPIFVLWDGWLSDGVEDLIVHPVLWDADQPDADGSRWVGGCPNNPYCFSNPPTNWANSLDHGQSGRNLPAVRAAVQGTQIAVVQGDVVWIESDPYIRHLELQQHDRPIGLENDGNGPANFGTTGRLRDLQVILSREKIEAALASGNTTVVLRMWDHWAMPGAAPTYNNQSGGDYTMVLRIERAP